MARDFWERASIKLNTRPDRLPARISQADLIIPSGRGRVGMFGSCGLIAFLLSIFVVLIPCVLLVAFTPIETLGHWPYLAAGVFIVVGWPCLYIAAVREDEALSRQAPEL